MSGSKEQLCSVQCFGCKKSLLWSVPWRITDGTDKDDNVNSEGAKCGNGSSCKLGRCGTPTKFNVCMSWSHFIRGEGDSLDPVYSVVYSTCFPTVFTYKNCWRNLSTKYLKKLSWCIFLLTWRFTVKSKFIWQDLNRLMTIWYCFNRVWEEGGLWGGGGGCCEGCLWGRGVLQEYRLRPGGTVDCKICCDLILLVTNIGVN